MAPEPKEDTPLAVIAAAIAEDAGKDGDRKPATATNAHNRVKQMTNGVIGRALQRAAQKNNSGTQGVNGTLRKATEPKKGKKAEPPRKINKHEKISLVTWNMAQPSKTQIQLLDFMEHDIVFLAIGAGSIPVLFLINDDEVDTVAI